MEPAPYTFVSVKLEFHGTDTDIDTDTDYRTLIGSHTLRVKRNRRRAALAIRSVRNCVCYHYLYNTRQKVTLKMSATDVIAILLCCRWAGIHR